MRPRWAKDSRQTCEVVDRCFVGLGVGHALRALQKVKLQRVLREASVSGACVPLSLFPSRPLSSPLFPSLPLSSPLAPHFFVWTCGAPNKHAARKPRPKCCVIVRLLSEPQLVKSTPHYPHHPNKNSNRYHPANLAEDNLHSLSSSPSLPLPLSPPLPLPPSLPPPPFFFYSA